MTFFLLWWLIGEAVYREVSRDEPPPDLATDAELLESELRNDIESRRRLGPGEAERLRFFCFAASVTLFFIIPLFWPVVLFQDDDDDYLR